MSSGLSAAQSRGEHNNATTKTHLFMPSQNIFVCCIYFSTRFFIRFSIRQLNYSWCQLLVELATCKSTHAMIGAGVHASNS